MNKTNHTALPPEESLADLAHFAWCAQVALRLAQQEGQALSPLTIHTFLVRWLARKYRKGIAYLMRWWCKPPKPGQSKTWVLFGKTDHGKLKGEVLYRLVGQGKKLFRWRVPEGNPYLRTETRNTYTSRYPEVAMAFASV